MPVYQFTALQRLLGQEVRTVAYYDSIASIDVFGQAATDEWADAFDTHLKASCANEWAYYGGLARNVESIGLPGFEFTPTGGAVVGTSANDPLPTQVAALVSYKANTTIPRNARDYLCGFTEGASSSTGQISAALLSLLASFGAQVIEFSIGLDDVPRQSVQWNEARTAITDHNTVSQVRVTNVWATQRRRRLFVGI